MKSAGALARDAPESCVEWQPTQLFHSVISSKRGTSTAAQLRASMRAIQEEGRGAVVYLRQEVAEDDLARRLISIRRPGADDPRDPAIAPMEQRDVGVGCQILRQLGISRLRLLTNAPKHRSLDAFGLEVVEHVPIEV